MPSRVLLSLIAAAIFIGCANAALAQAIAPRPDHSEDLRTNSQTLRPSPESGLTRGIDFAATGPRLGGLAGPTPQSFGTPPRTYFAARQSDSPLNGTLIGAAAGAAYGTTVVILIRRSSDRSDVTGAKTIGIPLLSAAIGAGVGYLIDRLR